MTPPKFNLCDGLEAVACLVQAMILCGRHTDAREAAQECLAAWPVSQAYLQAEASWRSGDLKSAMALLATSAPSPVHDTTNSIPTKPAFLQREQSSTHRLAGLHQQHPQAPSGSNEQHCEQQGGSAIHTSDDEKRAERHLLVQLQHPDAAPGSDCQSEAPLSGQSAFEPGSSWQSDFCSLSSQPACSTEVLSSRSFTRSIEAHIQQQQQQQPQQQMVDVSSCCRNLWTFLKPLNQLHSAAEEAYEDGMSLTKHAMHCHHTKAHLDCHPSWCSIAPPHVLM